MTLIRTLMVSITAFDRTKEKFYGFRQTVEEGCYYLLNDCEGHTLKLKSPKFRSKDRTCEVFALKLRPEYFTVWYKQFG